MKKSENDSNPTEPVPEEEAVEDDEFICRKCNIVFKSLPEYLEHKIKDENFRITQVRSKSDKRFAIPKLVQKRKRKVHKPISKRKTSHSDNGKEDEVIKKRILQTEEAQINSKESSKADNETTKKGASVYSCKDCPKTFRREATLRWHVKNDHEKADISEDEIDKEDQKMVDEELTDEDTDYKIEKTTGEEEQLKEIHIVIENPTNKIDFKAPSERPKIGRPCLNKNEDVLRPFACTLCGRAFKEMNQLKAHGLVHTDERKYLCEVENCPYGFKTKGCLVRHMRRHTGERPFQCDICKRTFAESGALTRHQKAKRDCSEGKESQFPRYGKSWNYHPNIAAVVDVKQRDSTRGPSTIPRVTSYAIDPAITTENLATEKEITVKFEINTPDVAKTQEVEVPVVEVTEQDIEMEELQAIAEAQDMKETQCLVCKKDFVSIEGLELHLRSHLADKPSRCGLCHFLSKDNEDLRRHILELHSNSLNDIEASVLASDTEGHRRTSLRESLIAVKQLFSLLRNSQNASQLATHEPSTAGTSKCLVCFKTFKGSAYLRQHMRMHTGERPFECQHPGCGQSFTSRDVLKKHMFVHSDARNYKCGECGKMFKRLEHVQQHLRIHFQERTHRCTVCDKLLKSENSLKVHMRTHSGVNPYICQVCGRQFRERGSLQRHQRLHTGEKPYVCPHCNRGFAEQGTLSRHLKAKMPCSVSRDQSANTATNPVINVHQDLAPVATDILAQFSSVADTQQYILPQINDTIAQGLNDEFVVENIEVIAEALPKSEESLEAVYMTAEDQAAEQNVQDGHVGAAPAVQNSEQTETLEIIDATTGESVMIVADKSIAELIKQQELTFDSQDGESSLRKIKELIEAAGQGRVTASTQGELEMAEVIREDLSHDQEAVVENLTQEEEQLGQDGENRNISLEMGLNNKNTTMTITRVDIDGQEDKLNIEILDEKQCNEIQKEMLI